MSGRSGLEALIAVASAKVQAALAQPDSQVSPDAKAIANAIREAGARIALAIETKR